MKLIKKIAAIMFAFMMVVSMSCNVKAAGTGKITIDNAKNGETYTIYQVLTLESSDVGKGLYSYIPVNDAWKAYFKTEEGKKYMTVDDNGYVTTKYTETNAQELAQALIKQAKTINYNPQSITANKDGTIEFTGLALGYYVVDTTVGTLCGLNTANPEVTIEDKNKKPTVEKKIVEGDQLADKNSANIGDAVNFKTTITAQAGAQNYVLHDKMTKGLTLKNDSIVVKKGESPVATSDYTLKTSGFIDGCTFEIVFGQTFCDGLQKDEKITVTYSATLNANAVIGNDANTNTNKTLLSYGDSQKTTEVTTNTKTFGIPVFKYTNVNTPLAGAEFILSTDPNCVDDTKNLKFTKNTEGKYRYDKTGSTTLTSLDKGRDKGRIDVEGLKAGTYYLKETKAPDGYNLLKKPVTITIDSEGKIYVDGSGEVNNGDVRVQNNSGTLLPNTGGVGTTMIYLIGGVLVLGSGVVLATKRRVKNK